MNTDYRILLSESVLRGEKGTGLNTDCFSLLTAGVRRRAAYCILLLAAVCLTRIPLAPKYLYYFDSVNFALALDRFSPALHQPQPPGYPLHVLFIRGLHKFIPKPEHVMIAAGILTASLALALLWLLGEAMFSAKAGFSAALLLLLNPAFWLAGLSNQVRLWLAVGSATVTLACWRALTGADGARAFLAACGLLGCAAGFRPGIALFLSPLLALTGWRLALGMRQWLAGALALLATALPWMLVTVDASGGWKPYFRLLGEYVSREFSAGSLAFGASLPQAANMLQAALIWNGLGVLSWAWAVGLLPRFPRPGLRGVILALWLAPAFLFHAVIHVGDPDHTLITVSALCLVGGAVLAEISHQLTHTGWLIANGFALAINATVFFLPMSGLPGAMGFRAVEYVDRATRETIDAIRKLSSSGPLNIVCHRCFVTHRHLSYYFPENTLLLLPEDSGAGTAMIFEHGQARTAHMQDGDIVLAPLPRTVWVVSPHDTAARHELESLPGMHQSGPVFWMDTEPGRRLSFGRFRLFRPPSKRNSG
jgi:hypothetical protein